MAKYSKSIDQVLNDLTKFTDEDHDSMLDFFSSIGFPIMEESKKETTAVNVFQPMLTQKINHTGEYFININFDMIDDPDNSLAA